MTHRSWTLRWHLREAAVTLSLFAAACSGSNLTVGATPTVTPMASPTHTPTATRTPTQTSASVKGLVVLHQDFAAGVRDGVGTPPAAWMQGADKESFDRSLASADWSVDGAAGQRGVTGPDGTFAIGALPPGRYTLQLTKTLNGNLVPLTVPFTVGDDGGADVVVEVGLGMVRTTVTYTSGSARVQEIRGPYGNWSIIRDGRVTQLGDATRVLTDDDGDGQFDAGSCATQFWTCGQDQTCGEDRICACISLCPLCEAPCTLPGVCVPTGGPKLPYRCGADDTCGQPTDRCVCVASCPACDDCAQKVCVPSCAPVAIATIMISGPPQLVIGRQAQLSAVAQLSDGSTIDVTYLADWQSSDETIATIDSWGAVAARAVGVTNLTASVGGFSSALWPLAVVERPTLQRITVQNQSCYCPPTLPPVASDGVALRPCILNAAPSTDILPIPNCGQVVQIGTTLQFMALGEFADGSYEDLTKEVQWQVEPAQVGDVMAGLFTARQAGTARLTASLGDVSSDATEIRVVTEPTVDSLSIYAANWGVDAVAGGPVRDGTMAPCFDCGLDVTVLRGDQLRFQATAHYDTGEWREVTAQVTWRSSTAAVATIDAAGVMAAVDGGDATIDAVLGAVTSNPVRVRVVNEATLQSLSIYQESGDRVVAKGDQRFFHATGYYDVGISRDVTAEATWQSSDAHIGGFETPGVFTAQAAGSVQVWAALDRHQSSTLPLEVFETSELAYCDAQHINRSMWFDDFNRVTLESDCAEYVQPGVATLRYTVTETQPHGGIFDPCLDLYVYDGQTRVRTIREEGCGDPFLPMTAPGRDEAALKYQLRAFWDLKDDNGNPVSAGTYTIYGRFYLYYDPVVSIDVTVFSSSGPMPTPLPTRTPTAVPGGRVAIRVGSVAGTAGEQQTFDVSLLTAGLQVAGVQNDIIFDTILGVDATADNQPSCKVNPAINKSSTRFAFLPSGCRPGVDCDGMRAVVISFDNSDPIADGAVLYTCSVTIPGDTAPGGYPLRCSGEVASDPIGQRLPAFCSGGSVVVSGASPMPVCTPPLCKAGEVFFCPRTCPGGCGTECATPVPTPAIGGACYIGSAACTGDYFPAPQEKCCTLFRFGALPEALSWCPAEALDPTTGQCRACSISPCDGLPGPPPQ